jgi:threonine-phosphate decarboxylase
VAAANPEPVPPTQDHGGNTREVIGRFGVDHLVDFSASINPLGQPDGLREHLQERWDEVLHYPDRECRTFRAAVAKRYGVAAEAVVAGNGSAELIDLVLRTSSAERLVLCPPDFGLYERLAPEGTPIVRIPRIEALDFRVDFRGLANAVRARDLVLLSNPGNPAGSAASANELSSLLDHCETVGATLAVDEAFVDFIPAVSLLPLAAGHPGLLVLRSLTKFYGLPGLRLGYLVATPERASTIADLQVPWSVNALAQAAGVYCLGRFTWEERTLSFVAMARQHFTEALARVAGLRPLPSLANFVLVEVRHPAPPAAELYEALIRREMLVRHCGSFGLGERYLRFAVRTVEENTELVSALRDLVD